MGIENYALYDGDGKMINVILWDGEANLGLPAGHKVELYDPAKHAADWAAVPVPEGEVTGLDAFKPRKSRLFRK